MKQSIKKLLIIVIYIGLIVIETKAYAVTGTTTNETTRLRREASTSSDTISLISQDTEVEITGEEGEWYQVTYSGYTGYIRKDMLEVQDQNTTTETTSENQQTSGEQTENETNAANEVQQNTTQTPQNETSQNSVEANQAEQGQGVTSGLEIGYTGKLTATLELKIVPSINSSNIVTINENTEFTITDKINKWCYLQTQDHAGWVLLSKVKTTVEESPVTENQEGAGTEEQNTETENENQTEETSAQVSSENTTVTKYVSAETLNVRESTDNQANIISQLDLNTKVTVVEVVDSTWSKITVDGKTGYVASKYLSDTETTNSSRSEDLTRGNSESNKEPSSGQTENSKTTTTASESTSTASSSARGAEIVSYAKQYLGYKYVSGGAAPSTGFDCSGFTYYIYKHFGITLSRTSTAQASNGIAVEKANLQAGDLVIFNNSSNSAIGHVGIYIGENNFIHAANETKGIVTTSLLNSYYKARYVSARRVIN